jgi:hypothetical protein
MILSATLIVLVFLRGVGIVGHAQKDGANDSNPVDEKATELPGAGTRSGNAAVVTGAGGTLVPAGDVIARKEDA